MSKMRLVKTNFTAGEISPQLLGRGDLRAYENGAAELRNVILHPTGGLSRRRGTYYVDTAPGKGRLLTFEFNAEQTYLLVLTHQNLRVYKDGLMVASLATPWTLAQLASLTWAQSADTLLLMHPDVKPKKLLRQSDTLWTLADWDFARADDADVVLQPYYKFAAETVTIAPSATSGDITLTASTTIFESGHAGLRLRVGNKEVRITAVLSPTVVEANVIETLANTDPTVDWHEPAFSPVRGWPSSAVFHQDRLVIGGSRDLPNRLWFSQSGDLWNFDKGTGLDSDAIEFGLFSDQINAIRALFSGRHLQVFTSGAEWIVTGVPLTPSSIQLNRQTRIGAVMHRHIPPVDVDGATIFVGRTGAELREFLYADVEQAYQANDLALLSRHLFRNPVDQCFDPLQRVLFLPLEDGTVAALTIYRTESVFAWSRLETDGHIHAVATVGNHVYALVQRQNNLYFIERFEENLFLDSALTGETQNPVAVWGNLEHLNNRSVTVIADGVIYEDVFVTNNQITLEKPSRQVTVGLPYAHRVTPLPPGILNLDGAGRNFRLVRAVFRLHETRALTVDTGRGLKDIPLRTLGRQHLDETPPLFTGDLSVRAFGWTSDGTKPLWRIEQNLPLPCSILGATMELKVNN